MKKRASLSQPGLAYTAFLFEPLGNDGNGVPLVLAAILGRMSLDPWSEAASLAAMPVDAAVQKLASLIDAMPNHASMRPESNTLAERLIRLLPVRSNSTDPATKPLADVPAATELLADVPATKGRPLVTYLGWIAALLCVLLVAANLG